MNVLIKAYRFIAGFFIFLSYNRELDFNALVKGKRIAIVGAANSAYQTGKGSFIDAFDCVIRINKAPYVLRDGKWRVDIGSKTDVLFHSFFENQESGGGPLDIHLFDSLGIKYLVNPIVNFTGRRLTFNFYKKYLLGRHTYTMPADWYSTIDIKLGQFRPTIGYCALNAAVQADFSELYITGFTFFKTAFGDGYRDQMKEADQVQKFIKVSGLHDPDLEFKEFLELLRSNAAKDIILDAVLAKIVAQHQENNNS